MYIISATHGAAVDYLSVHRLFFRVTGHTVHVEQVGLGILVRICNSSPIIILKLTVGLTNSIMGFDIPMYTLMYCPLLYYCFVRDTQAGYAHKLRHGQVQDEKSPLMLMATGDGGVFLRTQVDNAATVTFVDFDKVSIGNKIGVGKSFDLSII